MTAGVFVHNSDERHLIRRAKQRDEQAFTELYRRHVDLIFRYALLRVGDEHVAEDLTSEVFTRALEGLATYEDRGAPFAAWLYRIANARVIDYWRSARRSEVSFDAAEFDVAIDESTRDGIAYRALGQALRRLTAEQQEVIILKYVEGFDTAEIAALTGRGEGAVKALQHRALASLARLMDE